MFSTEGHICKRSFFITVAQQLRICLQCRRARFAPWIGKILLRRKWQLTLGFLPGKSHQQRSPVGHSPWGRKRVRCDLATEQQQQHVISVILPSPVFLRGKSHGRRSLAGYSPRGRRESGTTEQLQSALTLLREVCGLPGTHSCRLRIFDCNDERRGFPLGYSIIGEVTWEEAVVKSPFPWNEPLAGPCLILGLTCHLMRT